MRVLKRFDIKGTLFTLPEVFVTFIAAHVKVMSWTDTSNAKGKAKQGKFIFTVLSQRRTTVQAYLDCCCDLFAMLCSSRLLRFCDRIHYITYFVTVTTEEFTISWLTLSQFFFDIQCCHRVEKGFIQSLKDCLKQKMWKQVIEKSF